MRQGQGEGEEGMQHLGGKENTQVNTSMMHINSVVERCM